MNFKQTLSTRDKDAAAKLISSSREAFDAFEKAYKEAQIENENDSFFGLSAKGAIKKNRTFSDDEMKAMSKKAADIADRITDNLLASVKCLPAPYADPEREEISKLPKEMRPQLTANMMATDIALDEPPSFMLLDIARRAIEEKNPAKQMHLYGMFRNGMETLDLDPMIYEMLGKNPNNMSHWFSTLKSACEKGGFFKIPETKIIKVPLPMLQLSRLSYSSLSPTTLKIVDDFCMRAFELDVSKSYFVKTGVFSAKYDFRNAKVTGEKEVKELGEYLLYITNLAVQMMSFLADPKGNGRYGAACTNEWVVREYIEDKENNPCIYHGMPLHTEYRVFVDLDTDKILGITPYWRPDVMKTRFGSGPDRDAPDMIHDYIAYKSHENTLMERYEKNKDIVLEKVNDIIGDIDLKGQWSLDIMQNGDDFWAIDMAIAQFSALNDCVPKGKLKNVLPNVKEFLPKRLEVTT